MDTIFQPAMSKLCGQACVAMIAGIPLEKSIEIFGGMKKGTTTKLILVALDTLGYKTTDRLIRITKPIYDCGDNLIIKIRYRKGGNWHWVVWDGESKEFICPCDGRSKTWRFRCGEPTSYIRVFKKPL